MFIVSVVILSQLEMKHTSCTDWSCVSTLSRLSLAMLYLPQDETLRSYAVGGGFTDFARRWVVVNWLCVSYLEVGKYDDIIFWWSCCLICFISWLVLYNSSGGVYPYTRCAMEDFQCSSVLTGKTIVGEIHCWW